MSWESALKIAALVLVPIAAVAGIVAHGIKIRKRIQEKPEFFFTVEAFAPSPILVPVVPYTGNTTSVGAALHLSCTVTNKGHAVLVPKSYGFTLLDHDNPELCIEFRRARIPEVSSESIDTNVHQAFAMNPDIDLGLIGYKKLEHGDEIVAEALMHDYKLDFETLNSLLCRDSTFLRVRCTDVFHNDHFCDVPIHPQIVTGPITLSRHGTDVTPRT